MLVSFFTVAPGHRRYTVLGLFLLLVLYWLPLLDSLCTIQMLGLVQQWYRGCLVVVVRRTVCCWWLLLLSSWQVGERLVVVCPCLLWRS